MRVGTVAVALALAACGRVGFEAASDGSAPDAVPACVSGTAIAPVRVLDVSIAAPGDSCNVDNVRALDGAVAGLDRSVVLMCDSSWDPVEASCGCLAIDFGRVHPIDTLSIWAAPAPAACDGAPCQADLCGTGHRFGVLLGTVAGTYAPLASIDLIDTAITQYTQPVGQDARFLVLCRQSFSSARDDIVVDYVEATCM